MAMKAVITDYEYPDVDTERAIITGAGFELADFQAKTEAELIAAAHDADAVIVQYANMTRKVIEKLEHCKMIIKYGIGVNNIDADAATERGIHVCNVPDYGLDEVSNHAIAMLMALARNLINVNKATKDGGWGTDAIRPLTRLAGRTLGLVGFGALGRLVARKMGGFELNIIACDPYFDKAKGAELNVREVDFGTLCRESDYISVHCPHNKHTERLFSRGAFRNMKKTAFFVNTARGGVVDEAALIEALGKGEIAGAGLDVFEHEPVAKDSRLLKMPNVIVTSHIAWYSEQAIATLQRKTAEEVVNVLKGNKPFNACNKI